MADHDKQGACKDVNMTEATPESGEVNREDPDANNTSSNILNPTHTSQCKENEPDRREKAGHPDSSQNHQGQFIPTCISTYQHNTSAFTL